MTALDVAKDPQATLIGFTLGDLAQYTREGAFPADDSPDFRMFYVGRDDVHGVLKHLLSRCARSLVFNMFGYDDDELDQIIQGLILNEHVYVQATLDKSQAGGVHEKKILAAWPASVRTSFAVGQSATHQISHTKGGVLDGVVGWEGSTNWSDSGEGTHVAGKPYKAQNNTLAVFTSPPQVQRFQTELTEEHVVALHQSQPKDTP